jgi:hypothetical protein
MVSGIASVPSGAILASTGSTNTVGGSVTAGPLAGIQDALQAFQTLKTQALSPSDAQKSAALQKLQSLKAELKALMMLGGDPKQRAQEAAAIAKQIAAATESYFQAGGDPSAAGAAPAVAATATAATTTTSQDPTADRASSEATETTAAPTTAAPTPAQTPSAGGEPIQGQTTAATPSNGSSQADAAFIQEARDLAQQAKAIIKAAAQSLRSTPQALDPATDGAGDAAASAVEQAASGLGVAASGGYDGAIALPTAPAISITA